MSKSSIESKIDVLVSTIPGLSRAIAAELLSAANGEIDVVMQMLTSEEDDDEEDDDHGSHLVHSIDQSVVDVHGPQTSSCGYCKGRNRRSFGITAEKLTVSDYQLMCDNGWRRSGDYCYKPSNFADDGKAESMQCCPHYTIRLPVDRFKPDKHHRQVSSKMNRYLNGEIELTKHDESHDDDDMDTSGSQVARSSSSMSMDMSFSQTVTTESTPNQQNNQANNLSINQPDNQSTKRSRKNSKVDFESPESIAEKQRQLELAAAMLDCAIEVQKSTCLIATSINLSDLASRQKIYTVNRSATKQAQCSSNIAMIIFAAERALKSENQQSTALSIATAISAVASRRGIECEAKTPGFINFTHIQPTHVAKQSNDQSINQSIDQSTNPFPKHTFTITHVPAQFTQESFELYSKYQQAIHGDPPSKCTPQSFKRFLCKSPLVDNITKSSSADSSDAKKEPEYGSFHQYYRIDDKLIAVGVVDIMPHCLSSVYFFYDPAYSSLSPGVYSALCEIDWVKQFKLTHPQCTFVYLGYYIHSCKKMKYKRQFKPTQILCPIRCTWHLLDQCIKQLDESQLVIFSDVAAECDEEGNIKEEFEPSATPSPYAPSMLTLGQVQKQDDDMVTATLPVVPAILRGEMIKFAQILRSLPNRYLSLFREYTRWMGPELAKSIIIHLR